MRRSIAVAGCLAFVLFACRDGIYPGFEPGPSFVISDGNSGGPNDNPHVFVLGPIGSDDPTGHGTFNPLADVIFDMCKWGRAFDGSLLPPDCDADVVRTVSRSDDIQLGAEFFQYRWRDGDGVTFETRDVYRIRIRWGTFELGFADVQVLENSNDKPDSFAGVPFYGSQLSAGFNIKVRVDEGALCWAKYGDADCQESTIDPNTDNIIILDDNLQLVINSGFVDDGARTFTVRRATDRPCLPTRFRQWEGCYEIEMEPPLGEDDQGDPVEFAPHTVFLAMCLDTRPNGGANKHQVDLFRAADAVTEPIERLNVAPDVDPLPGSFCADFNDSVTLPGGYFIGDLAMRTGLYRLLAHGAVRRPLEFVFGQRLYAGDVALHRDLRTLSRFGWVREIELEGSSPGGLVGTSVPVTAQVLSVHAIEENNAADLGVAGVNVEFACVSANCTAASTAQNAATSNGDGYATTSWTFTEAGTYQFEATTPADGAEDHVFAVTVFAWQVTFLTPVADSNTDALPEQNTTASGFVRISCAGDGAGACPGLGTPLNLPFTDSDYRGGRYQIGWKLEGAAAGDALKFEIVLGTDPAGPALPDSHVIVVASAPKYNVGSNLPIRFRIER